MVYVKSSVKILLCIQCYTLGCKTLDEKQNVKQLSEHDYHTPLMLVSWWETFLITYYLKYLIMILITILVWC